MADEEQQEQRALALAELLARIEELERKVAELEQANTKRQSDLQHLKLQLR